MSFNIEIESGTTARLLVGGKYCDRDIVVTATGGTFDGLYVNELITSISADTFNGCKWITGADVPNVVSIGGSAFRGSKLESINAPKLTTVYTHAFVGCPLVECDFPMATKINTYAFASCTELTTVILRSNTMVTLTNANAFYSTKIADGTGYIYVPAELVDSYKADSNWSVYANQIRAIEDYPDICGETETNLGGTE